MKMIWFVYKNLLLFTNWDRDLVKIIKQDEISVIRVDSEKHMQPGLQEVRFVTASFATPH